MTIRLRLTLWYMFTITLFLCAIFALTYIALEKTLMDQSIDNLIRSSIVIADEVDDEDDDFELDEEDEERLADDVIYAIYSRNNQWQHGERAAWVNDIAIAYNEVREVSHNGKGWLVYDRRAYDDDEMVGWARVLLPLDMQAFLYKLLLAGLIIAPLGVLLAAIGGLFIAGRALKPVAAITRTAELMGAGNLSIRIQHSANDEVGKLSRAFNEMAGNLEQAFAREKQFTSDASHEMRTPLAVIIGYAEDALKRQELDRFADAMTIILNKSRQMQGMLNQLLALARGYEQALCMEKLDLSDIIEDIAEGMREQAERRGMKIGLDLTPNLVISADKLTITRMLMNLLSNSIKYGKESGFISIRTDVDAQNALITVCDDGIGIAEGDQAHVFKRFYRGDKSRTGNSGAGLGLSFVEMAAKLHGGSVSLESKAGDGACFRIKLPLNLLAISTI